jgi:hypothetical protein
MKKKVTTKIKIKPARQGRKYMDDLLAPVRISKMILTEPKVNLGKFSYTG